MTTRVRRSEKFKKRRFKWTYIIPIICIVIFVGYFFVLKLLGPTGNVYLHVESVKQIDTLKAGSIIAILDDSYYYGGPELSLCGPITVKGNLYADDEDGNKVWKTPQIVIIPENDSKEYEAIIRGFSSDERVVYEVSAELEKIGDGFEPDAEMEFDRIGKDDYRVEINSSCVSIGMHFLPRNHDNLSLETKKRFDDSNDKIEVVFNNCIAYIPNGDDPIRIKPRFWIQEEKAYDEDFGEEWCCSSFEMIGEIQDEVIRKNADSTIGRASLEYRVAPSREKANEDLTYFRVYYPCEFKGKISGELDWKYATEPAKEYKLLDDTIHISANKEQYYKEIQEAYQYVTTWISLNTGEYVYEANEKHYPTCTIMIDENSDLSFKYSGEVNSAYLNSFSLFPNFKSFLINNWLQGITLTIILTIIGAVISNKKRQK